MTLDSTTWAAVALVLTVLGAGWTYHAFRSRGVGSGVRGVAWTLLPVAAWLTGTLRLAGDIVDDVGHWASRLVFDPAVWAGVVLAGLSVVLFGATGAAKRRRVGTPPDRAAPTVAGRRAPALREAPAGTGLDDDVSEILRRHGIS